MTEKDSLPRTISFSNQPLDIDVLSPPEMENSREELHEPILNSVQPLPAEPEAVANHHEMDSQIFAYAVNFPIQKFLQAQGIVTPSAYISAATLVAHLLLSWVAMYELGMGLIGASLALSLSWWIIVGAQIVYILMSEKCKQTWAGLSLQAFSGLWDFFRFSAASAVMLWLETWYFLGVFTV